MSVCLVALAAVCSGCVTGKSHTATLNDRIRPDGTVYHHDTDWTISSPLNLPVEVVETTIHVVKQVGDDVVGVSCGVGEAVLVSAVSPPQFYVYDGYENIGWINNQMVYSSDLVTWNPAPPMVVNRFYLYSQGTPNWFNERRLNEHYNSGGNWNNGGDHPSRGDYDRQHGYPHLPPVGFHNRDGQPVFNPPHPHGNGGGQGNGQNHGGGNSHH